MLMLAMAAFTFTSCEDVPAPYDDPNKDETGGVTVVPEGNGTLESPFNCAAANEFAESLGADNESEVVYIKGKIVSIVENYDGGYGNATFYISDDGTTNGQFYVYRSLYLGNKKYSSGVLPEIGDDVIICGKIVNYRGNTPETVQNGSYLYSLNSQSEGGSTVEGEAKGDGTLENPYNSIAANKLASSLADGTESENVYIKGKIASIKEEFGTQFGNATFYISEDGTDNGTFYVFRTLYLGNQKYTGGDNIKVGDEVIIYGKVTNYMGNTPETVANESYLHSLKCNGATEEPENPGTGDDADGKSITLVPSEMGYENAAEMTTITLSDGTTITFDGGGNQNTPKYYNTGKGIRMYPKNSMKVSSSKKIASIVMTCDVSNGTTYNASGDLQANPGTVKVADNIVTFDAVNSNDCTITNVSSTTGAASQVRMTQLKIVYAE